MVSVGGDDIWCDSCAEEHSCTCDRCGDRVADEEMRSVDSDYWCESCVENYAYYWESSGEYHSEPEEEEEEEDQHIGSYSSSSPHRIGPATLFVDCGYELEVLPPKDKSSTPDEIASELFSEASHYLGGIERDGSISSDDGFEIVSNYGDIDAIVIGLETVTSILRNHNCRSHNHTKTSPCGLHVSLGRWNPYTNTAPTGYEISKLVVFWNMAYNKRFLQCFCRRWGVTYCQPKPSEKGSLSLPGAAALVNSDRYELINLKNSNRIEIRAFRGTTLLSTARACVELSVYSWLYCCQSSISGDDDLHYDRFLAWCRGDEHIGDRRPQWLLDHWPENE